MNKFTKLPLVLAVGGAVALGASSVANADVMATAVLEASNFTIKNAANTAVLDASAFSFLTFTSTGGYAGTLPGTPGFNVSSSTTPVDLPVACVGSGCGAFNAAYGANNSFTHITAPPVVGNYAAADQNEQGAPITGIAGLSAPATVSNGSYAGLSTGTGLSHSASTNNLNSSFVFKLGTSQAINLDLTASAFLSVYVTAGETFPSFATASFTQDFSLVDLSTGGTVVDIFTPDPLTGGINTISLNAPLPGTFNITKSNSVTLSHLTPVLVAGDLYQLSARNNVNADVQRVPEPESMLLLGIGLLGLGLSRKKRVS